MKPAEQIRSYNALSDFHRDFGLPKPLHPLLSVVKLEDIQVPPYGLPAKIILNFYKISFLRSTNAKVRYGQSYFDFDEGGMAFVSPNQVISVSGPMQLSGMTVYLHPDLIRNHRLAEKIKGFGFFSYSVTEALHLSANEQEVITGLFQQIEAELRASIDSFSQDLLASYVELLLDYSNRFYTRQFATRKTAYNDLLSKFEAVLHDYFDSGRASESGLPTVQYLAAQLNLTPDYLSDMLRAYTGQNAQQQIHNQLIEKAKGLLATSERTIAEVAYELGFEHSQSFSKLFRQKMQVSPAAYRNSFN